MKIIVISQEQNLNLTLPTRLIFSKFILKFGLRIGAKYTSRLEKLPLHAVDALLDELHRVKKKYGSWDLVEIQSADGEYIKITL